MGTGEVLTMKAVLDGNIASEFKLFLEVDGLLVHRR